MHDLIGCDIKLYIRQCPCYSSTFFYFCSKQYYYLMTKPSEVESVGLNGILCFFPVLLGSDCYLRGKNDGRDSCCFVCFSFIFFRHDGQHHVESSIDSGGIHGPWLELPGQRLACALKVARTNHRAGCG
jgi:hypothetical protein